MNTTYCKDDKRFDAWTDNHDAQQGDINPHSLLGYISHHVLDL